MTALQVIRERFHPIFHLRKYRLVRRALRALDFPVSLRIPGVGFRVQGLLLTHGLAYAVTGSQERNPEALFDACLKAIPIKSFWDIGANIGLYSWLLKTRLPVAETVLFEPLPMNIAFIEETIRRNGRRAEIVSAAVSEHAGAMVLHTDDVTGATSSLEDSEADFISLHWGVETGRLEVATVSLDHERSRRGPVHLIKIDVEGHEASVLRGAVNTIKTDQPIIFAECGHPGARCLRVFPTGYQIVNADKLSQSDLSDCANFFAFPPRHKEIIDAVLTDEIRHTPAIH
jgi:FkbM family methyltransferase